MASLNQPVLPTQAQLAAIHGTSGSSYAGGLGIIPMGGSPYSSSRLHYGLPMTLEEVDHRLEALEKQFTKIGPYLTQIAEVYAAMEIEEKDKT